MKIGFIGLGLMGAPMAKNLLKQGHQLSVYNRTPEKLAEFAKLGATICSSPAELGSQVQVVVTMVTNSEAVKEVLLGPSGVAKTAPKDLICVDCSTIGPTAAKEIAQELRQHQIDFIDAPVGGSVPAATEGTLIFFCGGDSQTLDKVRPVLLAMGKEIHYLGPNGAGQAVKIINNLMTATSVLALGEGMLIADVLGIPRTKVAQALSDVPAISPSMKSKMKNYVENSFQTAFSLANTFKDVSLAKGEADSHHLHLPVLEEIQKIYAQGVKEDLGKQDMTAVIKVLQEES